MIAAVAVHNVNEPHGERTAVSAACSKQIDLWRAEHRARCNVHPSSDDCEQCEREMQLCKKLVPAPSHHSRRKQKNGTHRRHSLIRPFSQGNAFVIRGDDVPQDLQSATDCESPSSQKQQRPHARLPVRLRLARASGALLQSLHIACAEC